MSKEPEKLSKLGTLRKLAFRLGTGAIVFAVLMALVYSCTACSSPKTGPLPVIPQGDSSVSTLLNHTVQVRADCGGSVSLGSGVVVSKQLVITAEHVGKGNCSFSVRNHLGSRRVAFREPHKDYDIAFLTVQSPGFPVKTLNLAVPKMGDEVQVTSYPLDMIAGGPKLTYSKGYVMTGRYEDSGRLRVSAHIRGGSSGGPAWDTNGNLLGVVVSIFGVSILGSPLIPYDGHYYIVGARAINEALAR